MAKRLDISETLRRAIKDRMREDGASYFMFGAAAGINPAIISRYVTDDETARRDIRMETAAKLADYLGLQLVPRD